MKDLVLVSLALVFMLLFGCAGQQPSFACNKPYIQVGSACCLDQNNNGICDRDEGAQANQTNTPPAGALANQTVNASSQGAGAGEKTGLSFNEWKAPDGSITLQVPEGWTPYEKQVDNCTVSWSVKSPEGTSDAFMSNEIMVFKSEAARAMYKSYGMTGIENVPMSGYLLPEQALAQIIAPLAGASNVQVVGRNAEMTSQFSQAVCFSGFASCDAQVFDATFDYKGTAMRGRYMMQTYDFGDGSSWWINLWGYETPDADWANSIGTVEKIFTSVKVTDAWASRCGGSSGGAESAISEVISSRQAASEKSAEEWDKYIRGE